MAVLFNNIQYFVFIHYIYSLCIKAKNDWNNNNYFIYQFMCMLLLFVCQEVLKQETTRNNNNTVKSFWRTEDCKRNTDYTTFNISMAYNLCRVSIYFSLQKLLPVYKNALLFFIAKWFDQPEYGKLPCLWVNMGNFGWQGQWNVCFSNQALVELDLILISGKNSVNYLSPRMYGSRFLRWEPNQHEKSKVH